MSRQQPRIKKEISLTIKIRLIFILSIIPLDQISKTLFKNISKVNKEVVEAYKGEMNLKNY